MIKTCKHFNLLIDKDNSLRGKNGVSLTQNQQIGYLPPISVYLKTTYLLATLDHLALLYGRCFLLSALQTTLLSPWLASIVTIADLPNTLNNTKRKKKHVAFLFQNWHWWESWELEEMISLSSSFHLCVTVKLKEKQTFLTLSSTLPFGWNEDH